MEVPEPRTVTVGENAVVQVILRNVPEEGSVIDITWYGFGRQTGMTTGLPPSPGASGEPVKLQLRLESSDASILGGLAKSPAPFAPNGGNLRLGDKDVGFRFYFQTLSAGKTDLSLTLTRPNASTVSRKVDVTVAE
ncbi:MAG: hypothetical protein HY670_00170 [Chloroflexi bacterium]|nr:hypothetical protein [Chloroflexota bacterium]